MGGVPQGCSEWLVPPDSGAPGVCLRSGASPGTYPSPARGIALPAFEVEVVPGDARGCVPGWQEAVCQLACLPQKHGIPREVVRAQEAPQHADGGLKNAARVVLVEIKVLGHPPAMQKQLPSSESSDVEICQARLRCPNSAISWAC